jgi:hypothetical protein
MAIYSMGKLALIIIFLYLSKFVTMISNQRRSLLLTLLFRPQSGTEPMLTAQVLIISDPFMTLPSTLNTRASC